MVWRVLSCWLLGFRSPKARSWSLDEVEYFLFKSILSHQVIDLTLCEMIDETWAHKDELVWVVLGWLNDVRRWTVVKDHGKVANICAPRSHSQTVSARREIQECR